MTQSEAMAIIKANKEGMTRLVQDAIEVLHPELAESEDERIRKGLISFIRDHLMVGDVKNIPCYEACESWLAYLEKQKEHFRGTTKMVEQKNKSSAQGKALGRDFTLTSPQDKDKNLDDIAQEYVNSVMEYNPEPTWNLMQTAVCYGYHLGEQKEQKPVDDPDAIESTPKQDYSGLSDFERAIHRGFLCAGVENVPVTIIKETAQDCLSKIKPAEWSEEDKKRIAEIEFAVMQMKSKRQDTKNKCLAFLKSLRPQPHWKPSEEQMEILGRFNDPVLKSLYSDLQKLL